MDSGPQARTLAAAGINRIKIMILIDFLYYYLTIWFSTSKRENRIRTPKERTAYTLGVISTICLIFIGKNIEFICTGYFNKQIIPTYFYIVIGFALIYVYQYIYINRDRYAEISRNKPFSKYQISDKKGIFLSLLFCVLCFLIPASIRIIIYIIIGR
jgi:Ca2+/Na+ antiporter